MRTFLLGLYLTVATVVAMAAPVSTPMSEFMISTGWTPANVDNALIARALSKAGFNTVLWPLDRLEVCRAAGLKLMAEQARPEDAAKLTTDSAIWGYHLADEPKAPTFPKLAEQVAEFQRADPNHPANINMVCFAGELLYEYMRTVKPEVLSYDHYQSPAQRSVRAGAQKANSYHLFKC